MSEITMWQRARTAGIGTSLLILGLAASEASAGCIGSSLLPMKSDQATLAGRLVPAVYRPEASGASLIAVSDFADASIVGLWEFQLSGFLNDFGTQAFHAGGTETMFSAGVDPETGDVCQGVWRRVGPRTYTLNHIAMAWTAPGAQYGLLIHIHMRIQLAPSRKSFTGTYNVDLFAETPANPFDESAGPFVSGTGSVSATRVTPD